MPTAVAFFAARNAPHADILAFLGVDVAERNLASHWLVSLIFRPCCPSQIVRTIIGLVVVVVSNFQLWMILASRYTADHAIYSIAFPVKSDHPVAVMFVEVPSSVSRFCAGAALDQPLQAAWRVSNGNGSEKLFWDRIVHTSL